MTRLATMALIALVAAWGGCAARRPLLTVEGERLTMRIEVPGTGKVLFASSLDGYRLHSARRVSGDAWEVQRPAHQAFAYFFMVDGRPYLPPCRLTEADDFGSRNCLFLPGM